MLKIAYDSKMGLENSMNLAAERDLTIQIQSRK